MRRFGFGTAVAVAVSISYGAVGVACGDDDAIENPEADASNADAEVTNEGGADADAGPTCKQRSELVPNTPHLNVPSVCTSNPSCSTQLDGTKWQYLAGCAGRNVMFSAINGVCSSTKVTATLVSESMKGSVSFQNGTMQHSLTASAELSVSFPNECHFCQCGNLQAKLVAAGFAGATCTNCNGGVCTCFVSKTTTTEVSSPYQLSGETIVSDAGVFSACASDGGLLLTERTSIDGGVLRTGTLVPQGALRTPEICDGIDNDENGIVDDDIKECACKSVGVCAEGATAECKGAAGFQCTYKSAKYEEKEKTCDGLDNDCDGLVDEMGGCEEYCDGKDNDGDGIVDNHLVEKAPCPTTRGVCASGGAKPACTGGNWQCGYAGTYQPVETACDGLDNDCNGAVDEGCGCVTGTSKIVMADTLGKIMLSNLDGSNRVTIFDSAADGGPYIFISALMVDRVRGAIYFAAGSTIERIALDGSGRQTIVSGVTTIGPGAALDEGAGIIYYVGTCPTGGICKVSVNAPGTGTLVTSQNAGARSLAVDPFNGQLVWTVDGSTNLLFRANLDGTAVEQVLPLGMTEGVAVDYVHRFIFAMQGDTVHRFGFHGEAPLSFTTNPGPRNTAVDMRAGKVYWGSNDRIHRANLDGTNKELLSNTVPSAAFGLYLCP